MKNIPRIDKGLNTLIFIGELCRTRDNPWNKERAEQWILESGGALSPAEQSSIERFTSIVSDISSNFIEAYFLISESGQVWTALEQEFGTQNITTLKEIFESFSQRFNLLWQREESSLVAVREYLTTQSEKINSAVATVSTLTQTTERISELMDIPLHLAISSREKDDILGWYSAFGTKMDLVLECSGVSQEEFPFLDAVLLHEIFHIALKKNPQISSLITETTKNNLDFVSSLSEEIPQPQIIEELLISSFTPEGCLASQNFGTTVEKVDDYIPHNFVSIRRYCAHIMRQTAQQYINQNKSIDREYLSLLIEKIKNG